jgi:hypothetical protein
MENRTGRDVETVAGESRKPWVRPAVQEMSAGSAEDAKGKGADLVNPS